MQSCERTIKDLENEIKVIRKHQKEHYPVLLVAAKQNLIAGIAFVLSLVCVVIQIYMLIKQ